jgi:hypothetical protein
MADVAFDAFSQRRNTGVKNTVERKVVVDTLTDPNRYQMPPARRLDVVATPKSTFVAPEKSNITALAEGLSEVQPDIMKYLADKQIEANKQAIEYGKQVAMGTAAYENQDTEFVDDKWKEYGYRLQKGVLLGERLSAQFTQDAATRDLRGQDFDSWANDWWKQANKENPQIAMLDPDVRDAFDRPFNKAAIGARNKDMVAVDTLKTEDQYNTASEVIYEEFLDLFEKNPYHTPDEAWLVMKKDLTHLNRLTHEQQDKIKVESLIRIAMEKLDARALEPLMRKSLGVDNSKGYEEIVEMPNSLYHSKYKKDIIKARNDIAAKKLALENQAYTQKQREKAMFNEFETDGHTEVSAFLGYDPAIVMTMDPDSGQRATAYDNRGKQEFTKIYKAKIEQGIKHEQAKDEAVEAVKQLMYGFESPAHFEARQEFARWFSDTSFKIQQTISTDSGREQLAQVYAAEGEAGFTRLFEKLDPRTVQQLTNIAVGTQKDKTLQSRKTKNKLPGKLERGSAKGLKKIEDVENNVLPRTWDDKSVKFNEAFEAIRAKESNKMFSDQQLFDWMMKQNKYKNL